MAVGCSVIPQVFCNRGRRCVPVIDSAAKRGRRFVCSDVQGHYQEERRHKRAQLPSLTLIHVNLRFGNISILSTSKSSCNVQ